MRFLGLSVTWKSGLVLPYPLARPFTPQYTLDSSSRDRAGLPLVSSAAGCGCCSTGASSAPAVVSSGSTVEFAVEGLTCGHCVQTVKKAVAAVDGVESAFVDLVSGGSFPGDCLRYGRELCCV
ncbi:heavy-metal-associated domain-containing protein [Pseudarthrobacter cellobiosi]|uniref:heavy-metal-associated domain-containing protein n=1 Tax=Pseudarthrobacter cellobiosi TaxID=2953654 RepID=UPI0035AC23CE